MNKDTGALAAVIPLNPVPTPAPAPSPKAPASPPARSEADLRLVIEEDKATGEFVYTTLDRNTGEVVLQLPRKEVLKSLASGEYSAGDVIKARI